MGGNVPLGYDVENRKLIVNPAEAEQVRHIFRRYFELGCVARLKQALDQEGLRSKCWAASGRLVGGVTYARGRSTPILRNRLYRGEIAHKGNV